MQKQLFASQTFMTKRINVKGKTLYLYRSTWLDFIPSSKCSGKTMNVHKFFPLKLLLSKPATFNKKKFPFSHYAKNKLPGKGRVIFSRLAHVWDICMLVSIASTGDTPFGTSTIHCSSQEHVIYNIFAIHHNSIYFMSVINIAVGFIDIVVHHNSKEK